MYINTFPIILISSSYILITFIIYKHPYHIYGYLYISFHHPLVQRFCRKVQYAKLIPNLERRWHSSCTIDNNNNNKKILVSFGWNDTGPLSDTLLFDIGTYISLLSIPIPSTF